MFGLVALTTQGCIAHSTSINRFFFFLDSSQDLKKNRISRGGAVSLRNSRLVLTANQRRGHFAMLVLLRCSQILTVTPSLTHDMDMSISLERAWGSLESRRAVMEHKHHSAPFRSWNWNCWNCFTVPEVGLWLTSLVQIAPLLMWSENKKSTWIRKALHYHKVCKNPTWRNVLNISDQYDKTSTLSYVVFTCTLCKLLTLPPPNCNDTQLTKKSQQTDSGRIWEFGIKEKFC